MPELGPIKIIPDNDSRLLDRVIAEQDAYYGRTFEIFANGKSTLIIDSRRAGAEAHVKHMRELRARRGEPEVRYTIKTLQFGK